MIFRIRVFLALFFAITAVTLTVGLLAAVGETWWQDDGVEVCINTSQCPAVAGQREQGLGRRRGERVCGCLRPGAPSDGR